jgi:hypothetical protein
MSLKLPKLKEVVNELYSNSLPKAYLVVSPDGWEVVYDTNKGVSGYVSSWYDLDSYDESSSAHLKEVAQCMLSDVKEQYV